MCVLTHAFPYETFILQVSFAHHMQVLLTFSILLSWFCFLMFVTHGYWQLQLVLQGTEGTPDA